MYSRPAVAPVPGPREATPQSSSIGLSVVAPLVLLIAIAIPLYNHGSAVVSDDANRFAFFAVIIALATHFFVVGISFWLSDTAVLLVGTMVCAVCPGLDSIVQAIVFKLLSVFFLPIVFARGVSYSRVLVGYMLVHFLITCYRFRTGLWDDGWQWCVVLLFVEISILDSVQRRHKIEESLATSEATSTMMRKLLNMFCDGFVLLDEKGTITAADQKAISVLGLSSNAKVATERTFESFMEQEGNSEVSRMVEGLRSTRLRVSDQLLDVETYTMPWTVPVDGIPLILGSNFGAQTLTPLPLRNHTHICAIKVLPDFSEHQATDPDLFKYFDDPLAAGTGNEPTPGPSGAGHQAAGEEDAGSERSLPESPRSVHSADGTQQAAAGPAGSGVFAFPGGPWKAVSAVGLGVGSSYTKVRKVGRGSQGAVFEVKRKDGARFALKEIPLKGVIWQRDFPKHLHDVDREVRVLKNLSWASACIVNLTECWLGADFSVACIVMEWLPGTLSQVLQKAKAQPGSKGIATAEVSRWFAQLALGTAAIHHEGFIHRDIKPSNILLSEMNKYCKIADLGVSRPLQQVGPGGGMSDAGSMTSAGSCAQSIFSGYTVGPGTRNYSSPEALKGGLYGTPTDMFSLGLVILEMLSFTSLAELRKKEVMSGKPLADLAAEILEEVLAGWDDEAAKPQRKQLSQSCVSLLRPHPLERPAALDLLEVPALKPTVDELFRDFPSLHQIRGQDAEEEATS